MKRLLVIGFLAVIALSLAGCGTITPLGRAANRGDITDVKRLLDAGEDANQGGSFPLESIHPLNDAVFNNVAPEIVQLLLEHGADVNFRGFADGWSGECGTPLHLAVHNHNSRLVKLLLDSGADTALHNCYDKKQTPLMLAREEGAPPEIVKLLSEAEARQYGRFAMTPQASTGGAPVVSAPSAPVAVIRSDVDTPPSPLARGNRNAYAVVVGIERYRQKLPAADFASRDAEMVTEYLTRSLGYPEENVVTLLNDQALQSDLSKYFEKWLPNNVEPGATVFVYYSGHGAPNPKTGDAYLVPFDGDPAFIDETGYSLKRMYAALGRLPAREVVVALDACFSGSGGRSVIAKGARSITMNLKETALPSRNMTVLAASSGDQMSSTYDEKGHGLFTYFLLKGIKNENVIAPDGSILLDDLFSYLAPQVERVARKQFNNEQTPQLIGSEK